MKCIRKEVLSGSKTITPSGTQMDNYETRIKRVPDDRAKRMVEKEGWSYCAKKEWKRDKKKWKGEI